MFINTEVVMSPNDMLSEIRYHLLKKLLHKSASTLSFSVDMVLKIEADELEKSSVKLDFLKKNNILWNFSSVLTFLKSFSKNDYTLQYINEIDQLTESLDKVKHDINFDSFTEYYKKIENLLDRMGVIFEIEHLNPSSKVKCNKAELKMLGWSKKVYEIISACENFSQMIELSFGPTKMRENDKEIKDYIKKEMYDESKHEQLEIRKMIHAAKKQQKKFHNGAKLTIILCAHMVKHIKFFLMRQLSPKQVKNGYNAILKEALRILDLLCFEINAESLINSGKSLINCKFLAGGGATEIELCSNLESFVPNENKNKEVDVRDGFLMGLIGVPKILLENNGLDGLDIIIKIIQQHKKGRKYLGCDIEGNNIFIDAKDKGILDDYFTKRNAIKLAVNTACDIINDCDLQHKKKMVKRKS